MKTEEKKAQHTPGPWRLEDRAIKSVNGANVTGLVPSRMTQADIHLVSAAPELLAALEAIRARAKGQWDHPALLAAGPLGSRDTDILYIAEAAISRAEGR